MIFLTRFTISYHSSVSPTAIWGEFKKTKHKLSVWSLIIFQLYPSTFCLSPLHPTIPFPFHCMFQVHWTNFNHLSESRFSGPADLLNCHVLCQRPIFSSFFYMANCYLYFRICHSLCGIFSEPDKLNYNALSYVSSSSLFLHLQRLPQSYLCS